MSLDQFRTTTESSSTTSDTESDNNEDSYTWDCNWHVDLQGYWKDVDGRFYSEDTPNEPPLMAVPEKLAAEIHIIDDSEIVQDVAEWWFPEAADEYTEAAKVVFNDFSTWHLPLKPWDKDYENSREHIIKTYVPEVIRWNAILEGENPDKAIEDWNKPWEIDDPDWFDDIEKTEMSEEFRKWCNKNADWLPHIDKKIKSTDEIELDVEDDNWEDDW